MKLVINIPAYNEAEKIGETIRRIPRAFDGVDEVVLQVVDDEFHRVRGCLLYTSRCV